MDESGARVNARGMRGRGSSRVRLGVKARLKTRALPMFGCDLGPRVRVRIGVRVRVR